MTTPVRERWFQRPGVAAACIAAVLVLVSLANDPDGYLGTDTGGKTATLDAMVARGDWSVDVGYWAEEEDPTGRFHPLYGTRRVGDEWVQVTSLPMVLVARPLWAIGGYRAALALPIAGTVAAALAAAALARRIGGAADATRALWIVGLASPLAVYGLDLWEHSLGVAAIGWATVAFVDHGRRRRGIGLAVVAGALLAAAATMRTESLVYTLVLTGAVCASVAAGGGRAQRRPMAALATGVAAIGGFAGVWALNVALEAAVSGASRTDRAVGAADGAVGGDGVDAAARLAEGMRTTFALRATESSLTVWLGVAVTAGIVAAVWFGGRLEPGRQRMAALASLTTVVLVVAGGLGFVPGLFAAFPVAAAALGWPRARPGIDPSDDLGPAPDDLARLRSRDERLLVVVALVSLPVVWAFQFLGGAGPQWGGRYVLASGFLLGVVGVVHLGRHGFRRPIAVAVVAQSLLVTAFGVAWLHQRSGEVADLFDDVVAVEDDVVISPNPFLLREAGPVANGRRWLSAPGDGGVDGAIDVVRAAGASTFSVLRTVGASAEPTASDVVLTGVDTLPALGVVFEVRHYRFT